MKVEPLSPKPACTFDKDLNESENMGGLQSTTSKAFVGAAGQTMHGNFLIKRTQRTWSCLLKGSTPTPHKSSPVIKARDVFNFLKLLEQPDIFLFISHDVCKVLADKYLLSAAFVLMIRAGYQMNDVNSDIFYASLFLAHDMEEDLDQKLDILPYALGQYWRNHYLEFARKKEEIWERMNYRALVSLKCCKDVMALFPEHWAWQRERAIHHSEATRILPTISLKIRGPDFLPKPCKECKSLQKTNSDNSKSASQIGIEKEHELEDFIRKMIPVQQENIPKQFTPSVVLDRVPWSLLSENDQQTILKYCERQDVQPLIEIKPRVCFRSSSTLQNITNLTNPSSIRVKEENEQMCQTRQKRPSRLSTFFQESPILKRTK